MVSKDTDRAAGSLAVITEIVALCVVVVLTVDGYRVLVGYMYHWVQLEQGMATMDILTFTTQVQ